MAIHRPIVLIDGEFRLLPDGDYIDTGKTKHLYPNGGSEASPAQIDPDSRYVLDNPFPGRDVSCILEVLWNGDWSDPDGFTLYTGSVDYTRGAKIKRITRSTDSSFDKLVVRSGRSNVLGQADAAMHAFETPRGTSVNSLPTRVAVKML